MNLHEAAQQVRSPLTLYSAQPAGSTRRECSDHVVVRVLELYSLRHSRILASLHGGPLQAVHASEVGLSGHIGVDDIAEVVEDLGRTVRRGIDSEWRAFAADGSVRCLALGPARLSVRGRAFGPVGGPFG